VSVVGVWQGLSEPAPISKPCGGWKINQPEMHQRVIRCAYNGDMNKTAKPSVKPISNIVRKYAKASFQVSTFGMSEGYDLSANYQGTFSLRYNALPFKSSGHAQSVERGTAFINTAHQELVNAGFTVTVVNHLQLSITN
jgi:hypothetical protein